MCVLGVNWVRTGIIWVMTAVVELLPQSGSALSLTPSSAANESSESDRVHDGPAKAGHYI